MDATIRKKFKESFDRIAVNFEEEFHELFGGGHAELRLSDEKNPLDAEIDIVLSLRARNCRISTLCREEKKH